MALSISVLNPFVHLARILTALEEARSVADPKAVERRAVRDRRDQLGEPRLDLLDTDTDEDDISLVSSASEHEQPSDSLAYLSLSQVEGPRKDGGDDLSDQSLSRPSRHRSRT